MTDPTPGLRERVAELREALSLACVTVGDSRAMSGVFSVAAVSAVLDELDRLRAPAAEPGEIVGRLRAICSYCTCGDCATLEQAASEIERLAGEVDLWKAEYEVAANWNSLVDRMGMDGFDRAADEWVAQASIQRMHNAASSVFAKWANDELMGRFKAHLTSIMHQAFVEGCIVGVRATEAGGKLLAGETVEAESRAATAEAALAEAVGMLDAWATSMKFGREHDKIREFLARASVSSPVGEG